MKKQELLVNQRFYSCLTI